jgi:signal transduction histidine kinase
METKIKLPFQSFIVRLLLCLVLVGAVPFAAAMYVFYRESSVYAESELSRYARQTHDQTLQQLEFRLREMENLTRTIGTDYAVQRYITGSPDDSGGSGNPDGGNEAADRSFKDYIEYRLREEAGRNRFLSQICVSVEDTSRSICINSSEETASAEPSPGEDGAPYHPVRLQDETRSYYGLRYSTPLTDTRTHMIKGQISVTLNVSRAMDEILARYPVAGHEIYDQSGRILYRKGFSSGGTRREGKPPEDPGPRTAGGSIVTEQNVRIGGEPWISRMEVQSPFHASMVRSLRLTLLLFLGLLIVLSFVTAFIFARYITSPLNKLRGLMKRAERGDLKAYWVTESAREINELGQSYNQMLNRLEDLIKQVKQEEALKKEAEIAALQYQLNPHFLYNTLNTIKWVAKLHKTPQISEVVSALVRLLQASLGKKGDFITLREEIGLIRDYMEIQRFRYGDRVQVHYELDPVASLCLVPRMLLQPLVENACIHGIEPGNRDGRITVRAWIDRDLLYCQVEDNGVGMRIDPKTGEPAHGEDGLKERMSGIGLRHIREKIKLYYGPDYKMHIMSKEPKGTAVRLSLPVHQSEV